MVIIYKQDIKSSLYKYEKCELAIFIIANGLFLADKHHKQITFWKQFKFYLIPIFSWFYSSNPSLRCSWSAVSSSVELLEVDIWCSYGKWIFNWGPSRATATHKTNICKWWHYIEKILKSTSMVTLMHHLQDIQLDFPGVLLIERFKHFCVEHKWKCYRKPLIKRHF